MLDDVAYLVHEEIVINEYYQEEKKETLRKVYCKKGSITRSEFYSSGKQGMKPSFVLVVAKIDYEDEEEVQYNEKRFSIYRTYEVDADYIELYCEKKVGVQS